MECSCGSSSFTAGRASIDQGYQFEFSTCDGCGRRAGERIFDSERQLVAFGYEAVQWLQAESQPEDWPTATPVAEHDNAPHDTPAPTTPKHPTVEVPVAPGARNYFMWSAGDFIVYVLYFHNITSNGHDTVHVPWLDRTWNESEADSAEYIALQAFSAIRSELARDFSRTVGTTQCSVTCAPPQAIPLATRFASDPIEVLFGDTIAPEQEPVRASEEAGQEIEIPPPPPDALTPVPAPQSPERGQVPDAATPVSANTQPDCQLTLF